MAPCIQMGAFLTLLLLYIMSGECIAVTNTGGIAANAITEAPEFTEIIENITVPAGRNVKLACSVKNLGPFKVAWIHYEQSAILTVHNHVITRNPRISVTHDKHDKHRTWFLHIDQVKQEDQGQYMCQINTVTAKTQIGYLHVVVPPNINDNLTSTDITVREGTNVVLKCKATGTPPPSVKWKRDDNFKLFLHRNDTGVVDFEGEILEMKHISRESMGAYLCIASNGVPPTVSKRIKVNVDFVPNVVIPEQLVGVPRGYNVTIVCLIEAHPVGLNFWNTPKGQMVYPTNKYKTEIIPGTPSYKLTMALTIYHFQDNDEGQYKCSSKNSRGESDGTIRTFTANTPTTIPPSTTPATAAPYDKDTLSNVININNSIHGQSSTFSVNLSGKGSRYQSNLNEIDKSEQKSHNDSPKGFDYTTQKEEKSKKNNSNLQNLAQYLIFIPALMHLRIL